jgi:hypothetical protein
MGNRGPQPGGVAFEQLVGQLSIEDLLGPMCPTCGPTELEKHPKITRMLRCSNCKEHMRLEKHEQGIRRTG